MKYYKDTIYATDVAFQPPTRPNENHQEAALYYSPKNKLYGYKTETLILPNGTAVNVRKHHTGESGDNHILRKNVDFPKNL